MVERAVLRRETFAKSPGAGTSDVSDRDRVAARPETAGRGRHARGDASMHVQPRSVRKREGKMAISCLLGAFKENPASGAEFLALANG